MKIFIDSARLEEIEEAESAGILDGVTTNPSLLKKAVEEIKVRGEKVNIKTHLKKILTIVGHKRSVSLEVIGDNYEEMVREGLTLYKKFNPIAKNLYIKIPINPAFELSTDNERNFDGLRAIRTLSSKSIPINCTLIFTPEQALMAAKAGAKIVSPFAGRIDDYLRTKTNLRFKKSDYYPQDGKYHNNNLIEDKGIISGIHLISDIVDIFREHDIEAEVLAASIRNARQAREAALVGAHIATMPLSVIREIMIHHKTIEGMKQFRADVVPEYAEVLKKGRK